MKTVLKLLLLAILFTACQKERHIPRPIDPEGRVLLMYDNINDHPYRPFDTNVAAAGRAVAAGALEKQNQRVIVYQRGWRGDDRSGEGRNTIYELVRDRNAVAGYKTKVLRQYAVGEYDNLRPATINAVVTDVRELAPAMHYGIAFGSHGLGWVPKDNTVHIARRRAGDESGSFDFLWEPPGETDRTRFLAGYSEKLDVLEFRGALDDWDWDFILLDDCFMASVESLYDLRTLADYIISSPTEIMLEGFPYDRVVSALFEGWESNVENALIGVAQGFVDYYENKTLESYATISLVRTSGLEMLDGAVRAIYSDTRFNPALDPVAAELQYYEGLRAPGHIFWDLDDYLQAASTSGELLAEFRVQLARTVVWAGHTDAYYSDYDGGAHAVTHFSGLSTFIDYPAAALLMPAYRDTEWYLSTTAISD